MVRLDTWWIFWIRCHSNFQCGVLGCENFDENFLHIFQHVEELENECEGEPIISDNFILFKLDGKPVE